MSRVGWMLYSSCWPQTMFQRQRKMNSKKFLNYFFIIWGRSRCILGGTFVKILKVTTLVATLLSIHEQHFGYKLLGNCFKKYCKSKNLLLISTFCRNFTWAVARGALSDVECPPVPHHLHLPNVGSQLQHVPGVFNGSFYWEVRLAAPVLVPRVELLGQLPLGPARTVGILICGKRAFNHL